MDFVIRNGVLRKYVGQMSDVEIPKGVTAIGERAFAFTGRIVLTSITIPSGVREIGEGAFSGCNSLKALALPGGVKSIGAHAFYGCTRLEEINLPAGVQELGAWAFCNCGCLKEITIPEGVLSIGECTFWGCKSLSGIRLPESVTEIRGQAFCGCSKLTCVTMPGRMQPIDRSVFGYCRPVLIAPNTPISAFDKSDKPGAVSGFARAYQEGLAMDPEARKSTLKYIRNQRKRYYSKAVKEPPLFRLMLEEKMIPQKDVDLLLEECGQQGNPTAKAALLEYVHQNFKPEDPGRKYRL